ncbi:MAG: carboxymuconolactone decarboxylase family protein [Betaproteobacteria bacterium]|nr:carboxymuconolactone decarboxylase family protein [Betaproteobacteria bacterium]
MPRLSLIDDTQYPDLKPVADRIRAERGGKLLALYRVLLNSPKVAEAWLQYFTVIRQQCDLPARDRELAIMRIARINGARYEFDQHIPFALKSGLTQAQLDAIESWRASTLFDSREQAVLAYTDAMTRQVKVPDEVFAQVRAHFDDKSLLELTTTIAGYNMVSRVLEAMEIHHE